MKTSRESMCRFLISSLVPFNTEISSDIFMSHMQSYNIQLQIFNTIDYMFIQLIWTIHMRINDGHTPVSCTALSAAADESTAPHQNHRCVCSLQLNVVAWKYGLLKIMARKHLSAVVFVWCMQKHSTIRVVWFKSKWFSSWAGYFNDLLGDLQTQESTSVNLLVLFLCVHCNVLLLCIVSLKIHSHLQFFVILYFFILKHDFVTDILKHIFITYRYSYEYKLYEEGSITSYA